MDVKVPDIGDFDEDHLVALRRRIGMIFQHFNLLSSRTVAGNIALPLELAGVPQARIAKRVDELLELVGVQAEKDLIQHDRLSTVTGCFEHEVGSVLSEQTGGVIDQVALLGQSPQIDGGVTHRLLLLMHTQKIHGFSHGVYPL